MSPSYCFCGVEEVHRNLYLCATPILLQLHGSSPQYKERNVVRILAGFGNTTANPINFSLYLACAYLGSTLQNPYLT